MKTLILSLLFVVFSVSVYAQVGIGNTDPKATLDITASNEAAPSNIDGILIPRVDNFPSTIPTANQDGMMVFLNADITGYSRGFYYWDNSQSNWIPVTGAKKIDDLLDGKSDANGSSIYLGINAGNVDDGGNQNVGIGYQAAEANVSGIDNVALGHQAFKGNINGYRNVAIGKSALFSNTTGYNNVGLGHRSLYNNITGTDNIGIGQESLYNTTAGSSNTAIGQRAMHANLDGSNNTAVGKLSLSSNVNGLSNSAVGNLSLFSNISGTSNTAFGVDALRNNTASNNAASGNWALRANTTGSENTALGAFSFKDNTTGSDNVALGYNAGNTVNGSNNVFIGRNAGGSNNAATPYSKSGNIMIGYQAGYGQTINNSLFIENSSSATPPIYGEFDNDLLRVNGQLQVSNPATTGYAFPALDGTANQVLQTNGNGQISFVDASSLSGGHTLDQAYDEGGAGAGKNITADNGSVRINGADGFLVTGTFNSGSTIDSEITGAGTRMFFNPRKAAIRAGHTGAAQWDNANIGEYSTGFGYTTEASGYASTASGYSSIASGSYSSAFGRSSQATGNNSFASGFSSQASGGTSVAMGYISWATGSNSIAMGSSTVASGLNSVAIGNSTTASNSYAIALGSNTTASEVSATAFGSQTTASGQRSTAFGQNTVASGINATAYGTVTTASGNGSTAFGQSTSATGVLSTASGAYTQAESYVETVIGRYNTDYTPVSATSFNVNDRLFVIGNGISSSSSGRSNALTIYKSGLMNINDEYNMPLNDGSAGQVMTTDGSGNLYFADDGSNSFALTRILPAANSQASGYTKMTTAVEEFDVNNNYNTSSHRFTAGTSGYYRVNMNLLINTTSSNASSTYGVAIYKNGTLLWERQEKGNGTAAAAFNIGMDTIIQLNVGQYLEFYTYKSGTFPTTYFNFANSSRNWIEIQQIR